MIIIIIIISIIIISSHAKPKSVIEFEVKRPVENQNSQSL